MDPVALNPSLNVNAAKDKRAVHQSAVQFEAMFMTEMMGHMFSGIETDGPFGGGHGEEVFRSFMTEQYGRLVAESGQTKISSSIEREMLRMQEHQQNPRGVVTQNEGDK